MYPVLVGSRYAPSPRPDSAEPPRIAYRTRPLIEALMDTWVEDAHLATYHVTRDSHLLDKSIRFSKQPELRHLERARAKGYAVAHAIRMLDADTEGHVPITPAQIAQVAQALRGKPFGWYPTKAGVRLVQLLSRPLSPEEYEHHIMAWLAEVQALIPFLHVDLKCREWTRLFRLPRVIRDGRNLWDTPVHLANLVPIDPGDCTPPPPRPKPTIIIPRVGHASQLLQAERYISAMTPPACGTSKCDTALFRAACKAAEFGLDERESIELLTRTYLRRSSHEFPESIVIHKVRDALSRVGLSGRIGARANHSFIVQRKPQIAPMPTPDDPIIIPGMGVTSHE